MAEPAPGGRAISAGPRETTGSQTLLTVDELVVKLGGDPAQQAIVDRVSFELTRGERVGLVGESGSGKTTVALSILQLLSPALVVADGRIRLSGTDLIGAAPKVLRGLRSTRMARVPQDSLGGLNPVLTIGYQLREVLRAHQKMGRSALDARVLEALKRVALPDAESKLRSYPHELSGGMRQRVMIAMALLNSPELLIADEPTTALDVTIQAQVISLLQQRIDETAMTLLLITHDIGVIASLCERVLVMYAGQIVEDGPVGEVLARPRHPYTRALIDAARASIAEEGQPAGNDVRATQGCRYVGRCPIAIPVCATEPELRLHDCGWQVRCHAADLIPLSGKVPA